MKVWIIKRLTRRDARALKRWWEAYTGKSHWIVRCPDNRRYWALKREG